VRGLGYGSRVVKEATTHIRSDPEADAAVLLTEPRLEGFYQRSGWERVPDLVITTGEHEEDKRGDSQPMAIFQSSSSEWVRASFQAGALFLPGDEW
jgi:hypothetical protein